MRTISASDKDDFMAIEMETTFADPSISYDEEDVDIFWRLILKEHSLKADQMIAFSRKDGKAVGTCVIKNIDRPSVELGCNVTEEYRGMGLGTEIMTGLIIATESEHPGKEILIKVEDDNEASRRVAEKCGAIFIRKEPTITAMQLEEEMMEGKAWMSEEMMERCRQSIEEGQDKVLVYRIPQEGI